MSTKNCEHVDISDLEAQDSETPPKNTPCLHELFQEVRASQRVSNAALANAALVFWI